MLEALLTVKEALPYILQGSLVTVGIVLGAMLIGLALGLPMAVGQVYGARPIRYLAAVYVWFFRGVPVLVLFFLFYFGLFNALNLNLSSIVTAALVLGLRGVAYQSQIFRGGIEALPHGQLMAARSLGMSDTRAVVSIILPQVLRTSIPGWANEYSIVLKDSAIAFVLGAPEILSRTHFVASRTYEHFALYLTAGVIYFCLTWAGVHLLHRLERRLYIPGYSS
jgi:polar amino acid transport system permease protein